MYLKHGGALLRGSDAFKWTLSGWCSPVKAQTALGVVLLPLFLLSLLKQIGISVICFCFVTYRLEVLSFNRKTFIDKFIFAYNLNRILIH
jgi:hypothetical protein